MEAQEHAAKEHMVHAQVQVVHAKVEVCRWGSFAKSYPRGRAQAKATIAKAELANVVIEKAVATEIAKAEKAKAVITTAAVAAAWHQSLQTRTYRPQALAMIVREMENEKERER